MKHMSALILLLCTCACTGAETLQVKSIYADTQCGDTTASIHFIHATELPALMGQTGLRRTWEEKPASLPHTDDARLALISLGQKPSGGYGLALKEETAMVARGVVNLSIDVKTPPPDSLQTQQLTRPCLVVSLPPGNYRQVRTSTLPELSADVPE